MIETSNAQATSAPVSGKGKGKAGQPPTAAQIAAGEAEAARQAEAQAEADKARAVTVYAMPVNPALAVNTEGLDIQRVGDTWTNNKGEAKLRKAFVVKVPAKPLGLKGDAASNKAIELGKALKPAIMGRVAAFSNQEAVIVRRYSETPGKRNKMSLTLEQVSVETTISKLAREYGLSEEEVRKRLNIPEKGTELAA
jgi:hypothetical protein